MELRLSHTRTTILSQALEDGDGKGTILDKRNRMRVRGAE